MNTANNRLQSLKDRFQSIHAQIVIPFSLLLVLLVICILFVVTMLFYSRFSAQNDVLIQNSLELTATSVEENINTIRTLVPLIRSSHTCTSALKQKEMQMEAVSYLDSIYSYGLLSVFLVTPDGQVLHPAYESGESSRHMLDGVGFTPYYSSGREEMFSKPHSFPNLLPSENPSYNTRLSYFCALRERPDFDIYGYVCLNLSINSLFDDCLSTIQSSFDRFYVIDGDGQLIYGTDYNKDDIFSKAQSFSANNYKNSFRSYDENTYFQYTLRSYPSWHLVAVSSRSTLLRSIRLLVCSMVLIGLVGIASVVMVSIAISRRITRPLQQVCRAMASFETGTFPEKVGGAAIGEIGQMVHGFNVMLDNIQTNLATIYREQEEKKNAEVIALRYQLQSLQNQINPHFLYNTLNVVRYLALDNRCEEIQSFIQSLNQLLRATLSNMDDTVPLEREISFLQSYLQIMNYRYPGLFDVQISVEPGLEICQVPKLILQPLVENALIHGVFPTGRPGAVTVAAIREGSQMRLIVEDNGVGMEPETVSSLLTKTKGFTSFGVHNVNDRLQLVYGTKAALEITSRKSEGTRVSFCIPIIDLEGDDLL